MKLSLNFKFIKLAGNGTGLRSRRRSSFSFPWILRPTTWNKWCMAIFARIPNQTRSSGKKMGSLVFSPPLPHALTESGLYCRFHSGRKKKEGKTFFFFLFFFPFSLYGRKSPQKLFLVGCGWNFFSGHRWT